ncbi:hypothetical protein CYMTET_32387 [Cymbomonas tetramitiformis]|uniref:Uncharacterized protein n=1 Tax=Cymbomonas tetramitiformis TaxID=36881 RepID=A0AAE0KRZ0_9CHLO|nr:hypothetical protein CYMTET_32387 [Cymbomonas tetramitiformis]
MACYPKICLQTLLVLAWFGLSAAVRYNFKNYTLPPRHHRLLLTSNGLSSVPIQQAFTKLLKSKNSYKPKVLYIPDAALAEGQSEDSLCSKKQRELSGLGASTVDCMQIKGKLKHQLQETLPRYDALYLEYGNTFYLRYHMHQSGFDELIAPLVDSGVVYIGSSASTICAGITISIAFWKGWDNPGVGAEWDLSVTEEKFTGLGLVPDLSFFPHFSPKWKTIVDAKVKELDHPVIVLSDAEAYVINGNERKRIEVPVEDDL